MNVVLFGASGTLGSAVQKALEVKGHEVIGITRKSGKFRADIQDIESLRAVYKQIGSFDHVACAAGDVFPAPLEQTTDEQWANSFKSKAMGQINLVRAAIPFIADKGSFTLVSGVLTDEVTFAATIGTTINYTVEGFVKGAAFELPRGLRINCVSPTVLTEPKAYHQLAHRFFVPGQNSQVAVPVFYREVPLLPSTPSTAHGPFQPAT